MSVDVITELHAKPEQSNAVLANAGQGHSRQSRARRLRGHLHSTGPGGPVAQRLADDMHDPPHYEDYLAWRTERDDTDSFEELLVEPITVYSYDAVEFN